jgi:hypothetical protein
MCKQRYTTYGMYKQRYTTRCTWSRHSAVGIAGGYGPDSPGVGVLVSVGSRKLYSPRRPDWLLGPPNPLTKGCRRVISTGVKRQGREADQSSPTRAEVKKTWIYVPLSHAPSWRSASLVHRGS